MRGAQVEGARVRAGPALAALAARVGAEVEAVAREEDVGGQQRRLADPAVGRRRQPDHVGVAHL